VGEWRSRGVEDNGRLLYSSTPPTPPLLYSPTPSTPPTPPLLLLPLLPTPLVKNAKLSSYANRDPRAPLKPRTGTSISVEEQAF
jgi:hypothetical protein